MKLVSLLICTRDRASQLSGMLASLNTVKTDRAWEAVIVNNASKDNTEQVIRAAMATNDRIRYVWEPQPGLGAARDTGWRHCRGDIVSLTDDDCYAAPDYVDEIYKIFEEFPEAGVIGGKILLFDPADVPITIDLREVAEEIPAYTMVPTGTFHGANLSFRKEALEKIGGFDRNLGAGTPFPSEDIDAVASVVWAGYSARYDPRPVISHHHGRKAGDVPKQIHYFDRGRGAYYIKHVMMPDRRSAYLSDWFERAGFLLWLKKPWRSQTELSSAMKYVRAHGSVAEKLLYLPSMGLLYLIAAPQVPLRAALRRMGLQAGEPAVPAAAK